jgi:hypothetical protein
MQVLRYIEEKYSRTGWPFIPYVDICRKFGDDQARQECNTLFLTKVIARRQGVNGPIVEYLKT